MGNNLENIWQDVKQELQIVTNPAHYKAYIPGTYIKKIDETDCIIEITAPSEFQRNFIEDRLYGHLKEILNKIVGPKYRLMFSVTKKEMAQLAIDDFGPLFIQKKESEINIATLKRDAGLNPQYTFERFIVGNNNRLAYAVASAISENPGKVYNPFFLYSGVGMGKTHIIQAIGHKIIEKYPDMKILYKTGEQFLNEVIEAIRKGGKSNLDTKRNTFKKMYRNVDVLIIDDIHSIAGKETTQEEFFHTFNALYMSQKQIILTSDRPPREIKTLEERLSSRFSSGMIADIQKPDMETRLAILKDRNQELRLHLTENILEHIATLVDTNIRELEGKLLQTATRAKTEGYELTKETASMIIGDIDKTKKTLITPNKVMNEVCQFYNVTLKELKGDRRLKTIVVPRQICMYLLRDINKMGLQSIGELLGKKDHTTIIHGVHKIENLIKENQKVSKDIERIRANLFV